jgi:hypothetical protein
LTGAVIGTGAGVGVDSAWEQKKLEARKILENAAESPASSARFVGRSYICFVFVQILCKASINLTSNSKSTSFSTFAS